MLPLYRFITRPLAEANIDNEWKIGEALLTSEIKAIAQNLFSKIKIEKVAGEDQEIKLNQPLKPLKIKVFYFDGEKNYPVNGIKFRFTLNLDSRLKLGLGKFLSLVCQIIPGLQSVRYLS